MFTGCGEFLTIPGMIFKLHFGNHVPEHIVLLLSFNMNISVRLVGLKELVRFCSRFEMNCSHSNLFSLAAGWGGRVGWLDVVVCGAKQVW